MAQEQGRLDTNAWPASTAFKVCPIGVRQSSFRPCRSTQRSCCRTGVQRGLRAGMVGRGRGLHLAVYVGLCVQAAARAGALIVCVGCSGKGGEGCACGLAYASCAFSALPLNLYSLLCFAAPALPSPLTPITIKTPLALRPPPFHLTSISAHSHTSPSPFSLLKPPLAPSHLTPISTLCTAPAIHALSMPCPSFVYTSSTPCPRLVFTQPNCSLPPQPTPCPCLAGHTVSTSGGRGLRL